ncbi:MAG: hypothetical protein K8S27_00760 [Candidatus Omnitrophica bacterium]|nr:hypothetical protein [Candidatus Omnitrophota bacterium]
MNIKKLWIKFFKILFSRTPVMIGMGLSFIALISCWAVDFTVMALNVILLILLLITIGIILQIFLLTGTDIAREAKNTLQKSSDKQREDQLDKLFKRLKEDKDPRTEKALSDLRELSRAILDSATEDSNIDSQTRFELMLQVEQLFDKCVIRLEKTLRVWHNAKKISDKKIQQKLLNLRENIIKEVKHTISYLGDTLTRIQELNYNKDFSRSELDLIKQELEEGLAIAEKIDHNMRKLELGQKNSIDHIDNTNSIH